jgi:hypothetical protein
VGYREKEFKLGQSVATADEVIRFLLFFLITFSLIARARLFLLLMLPSSATRVTYSTTYLTNFDFGYIYCYHLTLFGYMCCYPTLYCFHYMRRYYHLTLFESGYMCCYLTLFDFGFQFDLPCLTLHFLLFLLPLQLLDLLVLL